MRINHHPEGNAPHCATPQRKAMPCLRGTNHVEGNASHCVKPQRKGVLSVTHRLRNGFTLIEVLVAATILFATLATAMLTYQTVMNSSQRAAQLVSMLKVTEAAQQHIQKAIRDEALENPPQQLSGRTNLFGVEINWQAVRVASAPPPPGFSDETLDDVQYQERFFQYEVTLNLRKDTTERDYVYNELAWRESLQEVR